MRKLINTVALLGVLAIILSSCQRRTHTGQNEQKIIAVSISPQQYLAEQIVGDSMQVKTFLPAGNSPETFDPTPSQIVEMAQSKAVFMLGFFNYEKKWEENLLQTHPGKYISTCIELVENADSGAVSFLHHHCHGDHYHDYDPHIWMSPAMMHQMAKKILEGVQKIDPHNKEYYEQNFMQLSQEISQVDSIVKETLSQSNVKSFVIYHPALSYFAHDYGLEQLSIENQGKQPTPTQLVELIQTAKEKGTKIVFIQPEFDDKNAVTVAEEIEGKVVKINPLTVHWKEEMVELAKLIATQ